MAEKVERWGEKSASLAVSGIVIGLLGTIGLYAGSYIPGIEIAVGSYNVDATPIVRNFVNFVSYATSVYGLICMGASLGLVNAARELDETINEPTDEQRGVEPFE